MGGAAKDGTFEFKETWWEKADRSGFKELGAEKSGFNAEGDAWWETWREVYQPNGSDAGGSPGSSSGGGGGPWPPGTTIEKSADKWARDGEGREWHEQWWEKYGASGGVEKGARKSGRSAAALQAWWETWGEAHGADGGVLKWTDKWAESGTAGARWGDKWEERFAAGAAGGAKQGETWRVGPSGERWSRTWGEAHAPDGTVRKYGRSTSGEAWDTSEAAGAAERYTWQAPLTWQEVIASARQLLAIETPPPDWAAPPQAMPRAEGGKPGAPPAPGGAWAGPAVVPPPPPPRPASEAGAERQAAPGPGPGPGPPRGPGPGAPRVF
jgi:hypothetical protein